jgi:hypothetical protein
LKFLFPRHLESTL